MQQAGGIEGLGDGDIHIDKNYGGVFIVWDRMFGTFKEEDENLRLREEGDVNQYIKSLIQ